MEQRPLRLGDIVDDYCPRERRITNHVIVALVEDGIRQTRCSTCDAEHVYKAARLPRKKGKDEAPAAAAVPGAGATASERPPAHSAAPAARPDPEVDSPAPSALSEAPEAGPADDVWHGHRRLIRAQLPRVEGELKEPRPIPEFTMHQRGGRGGQMYRGDAWPNANSNGHRHGHGQHFDQPRGNGNVRDPNAPPREGGQPGDGGGGRRRRRRRRRGHGPKVG